MTNHWTVGQEVVLVPSFNAHRHQVGDKPTIVTKVGRKYFTVEADQRSRYRIEDGREDTPYTSSARTVMTPEKRARVSRQEAANQRLRELGINNGGSRLPYTVEQLEAVIAILEASS